MKIVLWHSDTGSELIDGFEDCFSVSDNVKRYKIGLCGRGKKKKEKRIRSQQIPSPMGGRAERRRAYAKAQRKNEEKEKIPAHPPPRWAVEEKIGFDSLEPGKIALWLVVIKKRKEFAYTARIIQILSGRKMAHSKTESR